MDEPTAAVTQDKEAEQRSEVHRGNDKEIERGYALGRVPQEGLPGLRRRSSSSGHILRDCRTSHVDAELQKLTMGIVTLPGSAK